MRVVRSWSPLIFGALLVVAEVVSFAAPPKLTTLFPSGGQRGQTVTVTAGGEFGSWPVQVWTDRPGLAITAGKDKGKLQIAIAADAEPGTVWLRLHDAEGASTLRPFLIGTLPEIEEKEPNDAPDKAQRLTGSAVINGRLQKSESDGFAIQLKKDQTLVAAVMANNELGSPMDTVLQICELVAEAPGDFSAAQTASKDTLTPRFKEAYVLEHNDDETGLDPRIVFTAPHDGWFQVRLFAFPLVPSSSIAFAGGDDFIYRLMITTGPFLAHALPLAITRETSPDLRLFGWNIEKPELRFPSALKSPDSHSLLAAAVPTSVAIFRDDVAGTMKLPVIARTSVLAEESASPDKPQQVTLPVTISGVIEMPRDRDTFRFAATKKQKIKVDVEARSLGFPLDGFLRVTNAAGETVIENDDPAGEKQQRDPELNFVAAEDGEYAVTIRDTHHHGGPTYAYRLTIMETIPDFSLTLAADAFTIAAGKTLEIPITVTRKDLLKGPIEITVPNLPPGLSAEPVVAADAAKSVKLVIKSDAAAKQPFSGPIQIVGQSKTNDQLVHAATFTVSGPSAPNSAVWLTLGK